MRIIKLFLMIILCFAITSCTDTNKPVPQNNIIIAIYPCGTNEETYYFTLSDNELNVKLGTKEHESSVGMTDRESIANTSFMKKVKSVETKQLSDSDTDGIIAILDKLYTNDINIEPPVVIDSWEIQIYYKGSVLTQNCWEPDYEEINLLIEELKSISPIEINLHGWA